MCPDDQLGLNHDRSRTNITSSELLMHRSCIKFEDRKRLRSSNFVHEIGIIWQGRDVVSMVF